MEFGTTNIEQCFSERALIGLCHYLVHAHKDTHAIVTAVGGGNLPSNVANKTKEEKDCKLENMNVFQMSKISSANVL